METKRGEAVAKRQSRELKRSRRSPRNGHFVVRSRPPHTARLCTFIPPRHNAVPHPQGPFYCARVEGCEWHRLATSRGLGFERRGSCWRCAVSSDAAPMVWRRQCCCAVAVFLWLVLWFVLWLVIWAVYWLSLWLGIGAWFGERACGNGPRLKSRGWQVCGRALGAVAGLHQAHISAEHAPAEAQVWLSAQGEDQRGAEDPHAALPQGEKASYDSQVIGLDRLGGGGDA